MSMIPNIMECRYQNLETALNGIDSSNIYMIGFNENSYNTIVMSDDIGIYIFAQFIHKHLHLNVENFINLFYSITIGLGFLFFILGIIVLFKNRKTQTLGIILVSVYTLLAYSVLDVYSAYYFASSLTFISIYLFKKIKNKYLYYILGSVLAIVIYSLDLIRSYSSIGLLIFVMLYYAIEFRGKLKHVFKIFVSVIIIISLANFTFNTMINKRNAFLKEHNIELKSTKHHVWHSVYIGLGFIGNEEIAMYKDEVGYKAINKVSSKIELLSNEYFESIKKETISFIIRKPKFILQTLMAKTGVILIFFLIFGGIGLYYSYLNKHTILEQIPFIIPILFNSLFGILVVPRISYLLGFIGFSIIYSIYFFNKHVTKLK